MIKLSELIIKSAYAESWSDPTGVAPAQLGDLNFIFEKILNIATGFAIFVVFIMLVTGGFKYLTSGGDPKATESAKKTITYAILGVVLMIGIWLILKFIQILTGVDVTTFIISF